MIDLENKEKELPIEVRNLQEMFTQEFPSAQMSYVDYTQPSQKLAEINVQMDPIIDNTQKPEPFVKPIGGIGGQFRAELFFYAMKNRLPDPQNPLNSYLIYPSFDQEKGNVTKMRILKYPNSALKKVEEAISKNKEVLQLPNKISRFEAIPTVRTAYKEIDGDTLTVEGKEVGSSLVRLSRYSTEKMMNIRKKGTTIPWGRESSLIAYKNNDGKLRILLLKKES